MAANLPSGNDRSALPLPDNNNNNEEEGQNIVSVVVFSVELYQEEGVKIILNQPCNIKIYTHWSVCTNIASKHYTYYNEIVLDAIMSTNRFNVNVD